jgi:hypothetical protein
MSAEFEEHMTWRYLDVRLYSCESGQCQSCHGNKKNRSHTARAAKNALEGQLGSTAVHLSQEQASHAVARQLLLGSWPQLGFAVGTALSEGNPVEGLLAPIMLPSQLVSLRQVNAHTRRSHSAAQLLHRPMLHYPTGRICRSTYIVTCRTSHAPVHKSHSAMSISVWRRSWHA